MLTDPTSVPLTVLAPTNEAILGLETALGVSGLDAVPPEVLKQIVLYHFVPGINTPSSQLVAFLPTNLQTIQGSSLLAKLDDGSIVFQGFSTNATVIAPDITAGTGIIHIIDNVLLPDLDNGDEAPMPDLETPDLDTPDLETPGPDLD